MNIYLKSNVKAAAFSREEERFLYALQAASGQRPT
jgi:hypothetical protein